MQTIKLSTSLIQNVEIFKMVSKVATIYNVNKVAKPFFFKTHIFAFLTKKKKRELKDNFSEKTLNFCPSNCTLIGKKSF